jgi:hypothetical protein
MSNFQGINEASTDGNRKRLGVGVHDVSIDRCLVVDGFKSGLTYVAEVKIIASSSPEFFPGMEASVTITGLDDKVKSKMALGRVKAFLSVMFGLDAQAKEPCQGHTWESLADYSAPDPITCSAEKHPLHGQRLRITGAEKTSDGGYKFMIWGFEVLPAAPVA